jgi:endoglucanase
MFWADTASLGTISLAVKGKDAAARTAVIKAADDVISIMSARSNGYFSPLQSNKYEWGSNADTLNRAIMLALAYDFTDEPRYLNASAEVMNYILGRNALNFSFVSGYGTQSLAHPHHRFWGNQPANGFPPPPPGVVAGGPNGNPSDPTAIAAGLVGQPPAKSYLDEMGSYSTNEVAINWNAPLTWMASYLDDTARPILSMQPPAVISPATPAATPTSPTQSQPQPGSRGFLISVVIILGVMVVARLILRRRQS